MNNKGFNKKAIIIVVLFPIVLFFFDFFNKTDDHTKAELNYINSLNINLNGSIIALSELDFGHDCGIITVEINETSIKELDERKERKRYLGLIKNKLGYFVLGTISDFQIGDSIVIKSNVYDLYRNKIKVVNSRNIILPKDEIFKPYLEVNKQLNHIIK